jgi:hypothetical protein
LFHDKQDQDVATNHAAIAFMAAFILLLWHYHGWDIQVIPDNKNSLPELMNLSIAVWGKDKGWQCDRFSIGGCYRYPKGFPRVASHTSIEDAFGIARIDSAF